MARYQVSSKNIYGLRTGLGRSLALCVPAVIAAALAVEFLIAPLFYDGYVERLTIPEGAPGSASTAYTPVAGSIADMERLTEGFTFLTTGTVLNHDTVRAEDIVYHLVELDSGELVAARINKKALAETPDVGIYRLPVGVWREWTPPDAFYIRSDPADTKDGSAPPDRLLAFPALADTTHYIDMYGAYTPIASEEVYAHNAGRRAAAWFFVLFLCAYRWVKVRKWRFAPALLAFRDPLLPRNDLECWCAATFAIWSRCFDGMEGFPLVTGARGARKQIKLFRNSLDRQWGIRGQREGLRAVHELTEPWRGRLDTLEAGWDLCRATQLLAMMYLCGMLTRDELDREFSLTGRVIQRCFSSWDQLCESYLTGFHNWMVRVGYDAEPDMSFRREVYGRLRRQGFSPYSIPWDTDLRWEPGGRKTREVTKKLLKNYRNDF